MKTYAEQYVDILKNIIENGVYEENPQHVRPVWEDGEKATTKSVYNQVIEFDGNVDSGRMQWKFVGGKNPISELLWIWKDRSNDVNLLVDKYNCNIWNEWKREDGTIGKAYGYQLGKECHLVTDFKTTKLLNQVEWVIYMLSDEKTRESRRIITSLYNVDDINDMALVPCVYETHWQYDGKLNLTVKIRSNDMALGNPYNVYQYTMLLRMIAQVTGLEVGMIRFNIDNAHLYNRHIEPIMNHIKEVEESKDYDNFMKSAQVYLNEDIKEFDDFTPSDISCHEYEPHSKLRFEVSI